MKNINEYGIYMRTQNILFQKFQNYYLNISLFYLIKNTFNNIVA